jgi:hypothetical protein
MWIILAAIQDFTEAAIFETIHQAKDGRLILNEINRCGRPGDSLVRL